LSYFQFAVEFAALPRHIFARPLHTVALVLFSCRLPLHVVASVLPAYLLLIDFAALPEATALDTQNPSPVVTTFRRCEFIPNWKYRIGSLLSAWLRLFIVKVIAHAETAGHQVTCTFVVLYLAHFESIGSLNALEANWSVSDC